jgi:hypothetical protein
MSQQVLPPIYPLFQELRSRSCRVICSNISESSPCIVAESGIGQLAVYNLLFGPGQLILYCLLRSR